MIPSSSARATAAADRPSRATDWIRMPNAAARSATRNPIEPSPRIPIVEPSRPSALP